MADKDILAIMMDKLQQKIDTFIRSSSQEILGSQQDLIDIILDDWREIERYLTDLKKDKDDKQWYTIETILLMIIQLKCPKQELADSQQSDAKQQMPRPVIDIRCTNNENDLVKQGVLTADDMIKLKAKAQDENLVVKINAKQDLDFLLKPHVWNAIKKEYFQHSASMSMQDKRDLSEFLEAYKGTNENEYALMYLCHIALTARENASLLSFTEFQKQQGISPSPSVRHLGG